MQTCQQLIHNNKLVFKGKTTHTIKTKTLKLQVHYNFINTNKSFSYEAQRYTKTFNTNTTLKLQVSDNLITTNNMLCYECTTVKQHIQ